MKKLGLFALTATVLCSSCGGKKITPNPKPEDWKKIDQSNIQEVQNRINTISNNTTRSLSQLPEYISATVKDNKVIVSNVEYQVDGQIIAFSKKDTYFRNKDFVRSTPSKEIYTHCVVDKGACYSLSYDNNLKKIKSEMVGPQGEKGEAYFFYFFKQVFTTVEVINIHLNNCIQSGGTYQFYKLDYDTNSLKGEMDYTTKDNPSIRWQLSFDIADNKFITFSTDISSNGSRTAMTYIYDYDTVVTKDPEANPDTWHD